MKLNPIKIALLLIMVCTLDVTIAQTALVPDMQSAKQLKFDDDDSYIFTEGLCALRKSDLWGFIDPGGNWVIEPVYYKWGTENPCFSDGICLVGMRAPDGYGNIPVYIDKQGNRLFKNQNFATATPFKNGVALIAKETGPTRLKVYSFINTQGAVIPGSISPKFKGWGFDYSPGKDGMAKVWDDKLDSYGFVNSKGVWVIKPELKKFTEADVFSDGYCAVQSTTNFYWGFIDATGKVQVPFDYQLMPHRFYNGRALVMKSGIEMNFIDKSGNNPFSFNCTNPTFDFHDGYAAVTIDDGKYKQSIINALGIVVKQLDVEASFDVNTDGTIVYQQRGNEGLTVLNPNGTVLIADAMYLKIKSFGNGLAYVQFYADNDYQSGFMNESGRLVILRTK